MEPSSNTVLITTLGGFATLIATRYFDNRRAEQVRAEERSERAAVASAIERKVELARMQLASENIAQRAVLAKKIDTVGQHAQAAYKEANDINVKIANLGVNNNEGVLRIEKIVSATNETVADTNKRIATLDDGPLPVIITNPETKPVPIIDAKAKFK